MLKLSDFDYNLPRKLIAQQPTKPRDHSRLLVMSKLRTTNADHPNYKIEHKKFYNIIDHLKKGDVLVLNNSKVFPARLIGKRKETGGKVEVFLLRKVEDSALNFRLARGEKKYPPPPFVKGIKGEVWQCLVGGHRRKENLEVKFGGELLARVIKNNNNGTWLVGFNKKGKALMDVVNKIGQVPLPPYIKRSSCAEASEGKDSRRQIADSRNYQTVYADDRKIGSVAAPTAGLHFTPRLLNKIKAKGVKIVYVTLHVGLGTFAPVKMEDVTKHKMHAEFVEADKNIIASIVKVKQEGRRVIAVGTTSVRSLEAVFQKAEYYRLLTRDGRGRNAKNKKILHSPSAYARGRSEFRIPNFTKWVDIFIYPGYKFKVVDAMITNFHLPKSTLLMLVSAFAGKKNIDRAYKLASKKKYQFYSYGDAMFLN